MNTLRIILTACVLAVSAAQADTIVKLGTSYDNRQVTEGYAGDIEKMQSDIILRHSFGSSKPAQTPLLGLLPTELESDDPLPNGDDDERHIPYSDDVNVADVRASVYSDYDHDGFYTRFTLNFDVDSRYGYEYVYAKIYLRERGHDYELFHVTDVFEIYNNLSSDRYKVDSKLVSNFPAAYYDARIEILIAGRTGTQDAVDANTHSSLRGLPLEAERLDGSGTGDIIVHEHAGAFSLPMLIALAISGILAMRRKYAA